MKPLSENQARNCEEAKHPICKCRCNGALHGARRGGAAPSRQWYETLREDDPHFVPSAAYKERQRQERLEAKRRERDEALRRRYEAISSVRSRPDEDPF